MSFVFSGTHRPTKSTMAPKRQVVYTKRRKSKSTALTLYLINEGTDLGGTQPIFLRAQIREGLNVVTPSII